MPGKGQRLSHIGTLVKQKISIVFNMSILLYIYTSLLIYIYIYYTYIYIFEISMSTQIDLPSNVIGRRRTRSPCSVHQPGHFSWSGLRERCYMLHKEIHQRQRVVAGTTSCFERIQGSKFHTGPNTEEP